MRFPPGMKSRFRGRRQRYNLIDAALEFLDMTRDVNRRRFLQDAALFTAGAAAVGTWRTPQTLAEDNENPSAADTVVLGIIGTGGRGTTLAKEFAGLPGAEVAYVCDVDSKRMAEAASATAEKQSRTPEQVGDLRKILDDDAIDGVVIAAPDHCHAPAAIMACAAGKHVYVEKPVSHNPHEGELLIDAARKHNRVVQVGTQRRSSPGVAEGVKRVRDGEIGTVRFARAWINSQRPNIGHGKEAPVPGWLDYALWQGPAPEEAYRDNVIHYNWHWFWNWGTGEIGNNGIHALDVCRWGLDVGLPNRVTCSGGKLFFDDDQQTPDTQIATFVYSADEAAGAPLDRAIHWEHRTWHRRGFEGETFGIQFYGDQGSLLIASNDYRVFDMQGKELDRQSITRGEFEHLHDYLDAVRSDRRPNADVQIGVDSTLLCHLGNIAYRTGSTVDFNPNDRRIINNPAGEELWKREYRDGWEPKM